MNLEESAVLIGLLPAPAIYSPIKYPKRSDKRKKLVLKVMHSLNYISTEQYTKGIEKEIIESFLEWVARRDENNSVIDIPGFIIR